MYPKFPAFRSLSQRLHSFGGWVGAPDPRSLAIAGFFHVPEEGDVVQCFYCGVIVCKWEPNEDPILEHLRWARHCWFADTIKYVRDSERFLEDQKVNQRSTVRLMRLSRDEVDSQCRQNPQINELLLRIIKYIFYT